MSGFGMAPIKREGDAVLVDVDVTPQRTVRLSLGYQVTLYGNGLREWRMRTTRGKQVVARLIPESHVPEHILLEARLEGA